MARYGPAVRPDITGAIPLVLGSDQTITWPDAAGVAQHSGAGRISTSWHPGRPLLDGR